MFNAELSYCQNADKKPLSENPTQFRQYVVDETNTLSSSQLSELNTKLRNEDKATSNQIIVYLISSLDGESLEDVSIRLAEKNKIGKKDRNNGVLMLIVKDDRKIRIEVGYGLEGVLTDAKSSSIIRNEITPAFKSGNYFDGINKGVNAIIATVKGEYTADKEPSDKDNNIGCCFGVPIFIIVIFGFIFVFIISSFIKGIFGAGRNIYAGKKDGITAAGGVEADSAEEAEQRWIRRRRRLFRRRRLVWWRRCKRKLVKSNYKLQITNYKLQITNYKLQITNYK
ncbi:MAG: TPM domain-containing protein [Ignavibacteria bacterium]|nr:TPM domain-containing protein [Ignavibacteria bacterium]